MRLAVDTNVLVRYLTWDDEAQAAAAAEAIEPAEMVIIPTIVLCELAWVLKQAYRYAAGEIAGVLQRLTETRNVEIDRPAVEAGLGMLARGGDFADGVIHCEAGRARCDRLVTFDLAFARCLGPADAMLLGTPPS